MIVRGRGMDFIQMQLVTLKLAMATVPDDEDPDEQQTKKRRLYGDALDWCVKSKLSHLIL